MTKRIRILQIFYLMTILLWSSSSALAKEQPSLQYNRIISLSPSITEILFELNLEDKVVAVTRYCKYPLEAQKKTSIGGLLDPNFEMIYRLNPDLIIYNEGATSHEQRFREMALRSLKTKSTSIEGILTSIDKIGRLFDKADQSLALRKKITDYMKFLQEKTENLPKLRVLIIYWRQLGEKKITKVYIAGNNTFFNDLISIAGGVNAYQGTKAIISPLVSAEGILHMNPDVIIEIKGTLLESGFTVEEALGDWVNLADLDAYKRKKIFILHEQYIGIPGPRITRTMQDIAECLHPEIDWNE